MELFRELYDGHTIDEVVGKQNREQSLFTVQAVKSVFGAHYLSAEDELFDDFVAILTHDALIGVQDRHHENWGIVTSREPTAEPPRIAPIYDSARGLFCNVLDHRLKEYARGTEGKKELDDYRSKSRPMFGWEGWTPRPNGRNFINHYELIARTYWAYPSSRVVVDRTLELYDWKRVQGDMKLRLSGLFSSLRQALILTNLRRQLKEIGRTIAQLQPVR